MVAKFAASSIRRVQYYWSDLEKPSCYSEYLEKTQSNGQKILGRTLSITIPLAIGLKVADYFSKTPLLKRELSFCSKFMSGVAFAAIVVRALFYYHIEKCTQVFDLRNERLDKLHLIHLCLAGEYLIGTIASAIFRDIEMYGENEIVQAVVAYLFEPLFAPLITFVACAIPSKKAQEHGQAYLLSPMGMIGFKLFNQALNQGVLFENILPNAAMYLGLKTIESSNEKVPLTPFVVNACVAMGSTTIRSYRPLRQAGAELFVPTLSAAMATLALDRIMQNYFPKFQ